MQKSWNRMSKVWLLITGRGTQQNFYMERLYPKFKTLALFDTFIANFDDLAIKCICSRYVPFHLHTLL